MTAAKQPVKTASRLGLRRMNALPTDESLGTMDAEERQYVRRPSPFWPSWIRGLRRIRRILSSTDCRAHYGSSRPKAVAGSPELKGI